MLRRTAARAFGSDDSSGDRVPRQRRSLAADVLFDDLREALATFLQRGGPEPAAGKSEFRLSDPRPQLEGVEFVLEGPAGRVRCVNTLRGFLRVEGEKSEESFSELLAFQRHGDSHCPIVKPLPFRIGGRRTGFRFTSVPELVERYASFVLGPVAAD